MPKEQETNAIEKIRALVATDEANRRFQELGYTPLFVADPLAKILLVGHAPGLKAQTTALTWGDASGERLKQWLEIDERTFRNPQNFALVPMDFYFQGKGKSGDLPPRKGFAEKWHPLILAEMPQLRLIITAGQYAAQYYLGKRAKKNLTETVRAYHEYLPEIFPIIHPSPLNFRWQAKNPWFETEVLPVLKQRVHAVLGS